MTGEDISSRNNSRPRLVLRNIINPTFLGKSGFASDNGLLSIVSVFLSNPGIGSSRTKMVFHTEFSRHVPISSELSRLEKYLANQKNFPTT